MSVIAGIKRGDGETHPPVRLLSLDWMTQSIKFYSPGQVFFVVCQNIPWGGLWQDHEKIR